MSQIYKNNTGGGSGAVDSVTGTYPIIASPTTGNVVVSIDPPVYIHFIANTSIDFTTTGLTTIYTPPPGYGFIPFGYAIILTNVSGYVSDGSFNLGVTAPDYNDLLESASFGVNALGVYINGPLSNNPSIPYSITSLPIVLNIISGITATAATGTFFINGGLFIL